MKFNLFNKDFSTQLSDALTQFTSTHDKLKALNDQIAVEKALRLKEIEELQNTVDSYNKTMKKSSRVMSKIKDIVGDIDDMAPDEEEN